MNKKNRGKVCYDTHHSNMKCDNR